MIAIPASDVASNVHNMRGLQYTHQTEEGLASLPTVQDPSGAPAESVRRLISEVSLTLFENSGYDIQTCAFNNTLAMFTSPFITLYS
jgi:hypothetical protein